MARPIYVPDSVAELGRLADEIWFLAGDTSVDTSWYTKRGTLAGLYAAAEVFQTQDNSPDFVETERFVDSRLAELKTAGEGVSAVGEWAGYTLHSVVNVLRSKGMRI
jgi:ubiquinone biosynthesis protein COQ9